MKNETENKPQERGVRRAFQISNDAESKKNAENTTTLIQPSTVEGGCRTAETMLSPAKTKKPAAFTAYRVLVGVLVVDTLARFIEPPVAVQWVLLAVNLAALVVLVIKWRRIANLLAFAVFFALSGGLSSEVSAVSAPDSAFFCVQTLAPSNFGVAGGNKTAAQAVNTVAGTDTPERAPIPGPGINISKKVSDMKKKTRKDAVARPVYALTKREMTRRAVKAVDLSCDGDLHDALFCGAIILPRGMTGQFADIAALDGMKVTDALGQMIRWAVSQNSLCPVLKGGAS